MHLKESEVESLYNHFNDAKKDGLVNHEAFLKLLKGRMSEAREELVDRAFEELIRKKKGLPLTLEDIRRSFNPENHPDVSSGRRNEDVVTNEFLEVFEIHHALWVSLNTS